MQAGKVQLAPQHGLRGTPDVLRLSARQAAPPQFLDGGVGHRLRGDCAERLLQPRPDRGRGPGRDLLADDAVHERGEEVGDHLAFDSPEAVDGRAQDGVPSPQVLQLCIPVLKRSHSAPSH